MLSIIIPTRNEEDYLPLLLGSIEKQTFGSYELIVADKNSEDGIRQIAEKYGSRVVEGGFAAQARNNGAKVSRMETLLFMDADTILPDENFLTESFREFNERNLDIAGTLQIPIPTGKKLRDLQYSFFYGLANRVMLLYENSKKPFMQICMFVKRDVFEDLGRFDETLTWAEDSELSKRGVSKNYKFGILRNCGKVWASPRKFENEGALKIALKCFYLNVGRMLGNEFREGNFVRWGDNYDYHQSKEVN